jgi:hypothetical protein
MGVHLSANPYPASHRAWASWAKGYEVASKPIRKVVQRRAGRGFRWTGALLFDYNRVQDLARTTDKAGVEADWATRPKG